MLKIVPFDKSNCCNLHKTIIEIHKTIWIKQNDIVIILLFQTTHVYKIDTFQYLICIMYVNNNMLPIGIGKKNYTVIVIFFGKF